MNKGNFWKELRKEATLFYTIRLTRIKAPSKNKKGKSHSSTYPTAVRVVIRS